MATHAKREREFAKRSKKDAKTARKNEREKAAAAGGPQWEVTSDSLQEPYVPAEDEIVKVPDGPMKKKDASAGSGGATGGVTPK